MLFSLYQNNFFDNFNKFTEILFGLKYKFRLIYNDTFIIDIYMYFVLNWSRISSFISNDNFFGDLRLMLVLRNLFSVSFTCQERLS